MTKSAHPITSATDVAQLGRAFAVVSHEWDAIVAAGEAASQFESTFQSLLAHWNEHQDRRTDGEIDDLALSRTRLDELRRRTATTRRQLAGVT